MLTTIKNSLQIRLTLAFTLLVFLFALVAGGYLFYSVYSESKEFQDILLRQTATHLNPAAPPQHEGDNDERIYFGFPDRADAEEGDLPFRLESGRQSGFYDVTDGGDDFRVYIHNSGSGRVVVWQETELREDIAEDLAWHGALPVLLLIPLSAALTVWIVRRSLAPVRRLADNLERRGGSDLEELPEHNLPSEILPFVQAINRQLGRVSGAMQQQQRFIADAAHELRSPLTALSLQADRIDTAALPKTQRGQLAALQQGIARNRRLLEQLLAHARAQAPETRPAVALSAQMLFRRVLEEIYPLAEAKGQDIGTLNDNDPAFSADETAVYTLLKTLADNAVRYTPEGGRIDLWAEETARHIVFCVEDSGCGIPAAERARVLEPFYRILGNNTEGTGLGLSIADTVTKRYGGRIELADSVRNASGLLVKVWLDKSLLV
ncbi:ATP-binding protein [Neisseria sp.]|uniref:ATP-binding protein n=2 Tax=Neisseria sp. TaxID=192066 RepID=UPI0035A0DA9A